MDLPDKHNLSEYDLTLKRIGEITRFGQKTVTFDQLSADTQTRLVENNYCIQVKVIEGQSLYIVTVPGNKISAVEHAKKMVKMGKRNYKESFIIIVGALFIYYLCIKLFCS